MRILVHRVHKASVVVSGNVVGKIEKGLLVYVGFTHKDTEKDVQYLSKKALALRIFPDENGKVNYYSVTDMEEDLLIVSQFTLYGECQKGSRPAFLNALEPVEAKRLYELFIAKCRESLGGEHRVETGEFGAFMEVRATNLGPGNFFIES